MYPFSALQLILLQWQAEEQVEIELGDSDIGDDSQSNGVMEPVVTYTTQEDYDGYAICFSLTTPFDPHIPWQPADASRGLVTTMPGLGLSCSSSAFQGWRLG